MRLDKKIIRRRCQRPLKLATYLNISGLKLDILEHLGHCGNLHWLIASENELQADDGIGKLKQLWYLDLSNNQLQNLNYLSRFLALGTLILSNNDLKWSHLERLSHAHIMSLSLHGNPQMDSDPYYRIHVIDSLPLIWELDGRLVTVTERLHVKQFFIDTQYTEHPVRHKTCKTFQTTSLKNIGTEGIVSKECKYIYSKFPMSEKHTKHTDERRLKYLASMVQEDIIEMIDHQRFAVSIPQNFLNDLIKERHKDVEGCNMVLLLLVISLEFQLPVILMRTVLVSAQLDMIGSVSTMSLFLLPRDYRSRVASMLLNAAKVDRDNNVKNEGGLYPQLFMCLYYTIAQLTRIRQTSATNMHKVRPISHNSDYMALMSSEAVSLMIRNTKFYTYFNTEPGVVDLVTAATGSMDVVTEAKDKLIASQAILGRTDYNVHDEINQMILDAIEVRLSTISIKMADIPVGDRYLALSDSLPIKPLHSVIWASNFLSKGQQVPRTDPPILHPEREALKPKRVQPKIGDHVLLGPQVVGELTMIMEGDIAMARIDAVPVANGAVVSKLKSSDAHFTYVDLKSLCFAKDIGMWRPMKTAGDKYSIHSTYNTTQTCAKDSSRHGQYSAPLIYTPKEPKSSQRHRSCSIALKVDDTTDEDESPTPKNMISRSISTIMVKRVMSADRNLSNSSYARNAAAMKKRCKSATVSKFSKDTEDSEIRNRVAPGISCSTLHSQDNVHYIQGFTPREDSYRSNISVSTLATPVTTDRQQIVIQDVFEEAEEEEDDDELYQYLEEAFSLQI